MARSRSARHAGCQNLPAGALVCTVALLGKAGKAAVCPSIPIHRALGWKKDRLGCYGMCDAPKLDGPLPSESHTANSTPRNPHC